MKQKAIYQRDFFLSKVDNEFKTRLSKKTNQNQRKEIRKQKTKLEGKSGVKTANQTGNHKRHHFQKKESESK